MINLSTDFVPGTRYFYIFGTRTADARFDVSVNGESIDNPFETNNHGDPNDPSLGVVNYWFTTANHVFGALPVTITMRQGSMTVSQTRVAYPAKLYPAGAITMSGYYSIVQPIGDPKWLVRINGELQPEQIQTDRLKESEFTVHAGDVLEYSHGMLNGPDYFFVAYRSQNLYPVIDEYNFNITRLIMRNYNQNTLAQNLEFMKSWKSQLIADYKSSHS
jgi:hypothetical protein